MRCVLETLQIKFILVNVQEKELRRKPKMKSITTALLQNYDGYLLHEGSSGVLPPTISKEFFVSIGSTIVRKLKQVSVPFSMAFHNIKSKFYHTKRRYCHSIQNCVVNTAQFVRIK